MVGEGVEIEMAQFAERNSAGLYDVLMRMTGADAFNAKIDGKTIRYQAVRENNGVSYQEKGKTVMSIRISTSGAWLEKEVFLDGKTIAVKEDSARSKEVMPVHLLTDWQGKGGK